MAITNAQQYQQLVKKDANGKRPGYRGIGGYQSGRSAPSSSSRSTSSRSTAGPGDTGGEGGNRPSDQSDRQYRSDAPPVDRSSALQTYNTKKATGRLGRQDPMGGELQYRNGVLIDETGRPVDDTFRGGFTGDLTENEKTLETFIDSKANYPTYTPSYVKFLGDLNRRPNRKYFVENVLRAGKIPGVDYASLDDEDFDIEQAYKDYMSDRLSGNIDAMGNPLGGNYYDSSGQLVVTDTRDDGAGQKILPEDTIGDTEKDEVNPRDYTGLAPRFMGSIFDFTGLAEGGRVAAQQGGIMPRLNDLSGDVSSAEQMLQEINQRLESAESTLGEGGGMRGATIAPNMSPLENAMRGIGQPLNNSRTSGLASIANYTPFAGETFNQVPEQFKTGFDEYTKENPIGMGGQAMTPVGLQDGNRVMFGDTASAGAFSDYLKSIGQGVSPIGTATAIQSPLASSMRQGAMDGGRMRQMEMMEDEDDPTGGIMDLESGRQMYFLGKLVKKAGRAIKKVVKSPIGKAALLYFGGKAFMPGGGPGILSNLKTSLIGKLSGGEENIFKGGKFSGLANFLRDKYTSDGGKLKFGLGLGLGVPFALDALGVGKDENEGTDLDEYYKAQGIDIDAIRNNPNRFLARRFVGMADGGRTGYQEGGDAEPVAKKTMPLLDMGGMEKDYRKDGGFVPIGRMERADDVPARLSKNEFVFTADAVRNAGEGDIDKGAEVMYNMMKNLESGGEVSEESQGLNGAREMFQTSKRLEEVL